MSDPYRSASAPTCARCQDMLERSTAGYDCPHGHGFWDAGKVLHDGVRVDELGRLVPTQLHCGYCPTCRRKMQLRRWSGVTFEACGKHGVWVSADDADYWLACTSRSR